MEGFPERLSIDMVAVFLLQNCKDRYERVITVEVSGNGYFFLILIRESGLMELFGMKFQEGEKATRTIYTFSGVYIVDGVCYYYD